MGADWGYGEGFSAVPHDWDTKTPVCETSLDKGFVQRLANLVGVIRLHGPWPFDRARKLSLDHLRFLWVVGVSCSALLHQSLL